MTSKTDSFKKIGSGKNKIFIHGSLPITTKLKQLFVEKDVTLFQLSEEFDKKFRRVLHKVPTLHGTIPTFKALAVTVKKPEYNVMVERIFNFIKKNNINMAWLPSMGYTASFLKKCADSGIKTSTKITDDPESSKAYSVYSVKHFDKVVCSGVDYDSKRTIKEMFYKWGAKKVIFLPVFTNPNHYDRKTPDFNDRSEDIVYVGALCYMKWRRLYKMHKHFGDRFKIYSRYDPRRMEGVVGLVYRMIDLVYPLPEVRNLSDSELKKLYKNTKIGFNLHLSYGPSNARNYELCLNGAMQITDNPKGTKTIYDVGKEVICYNNIDEAIKLIEYYLENDAERIKIAKAGYARAMKDYTYEKIFEKHIDFLLSE